MIKKNDYYTLTFTGKEIADIFWGLQSIGFYGFTFYRFKKILEDNIVSTNWGYDNYISYLFTPKETPEQKLLRELKQQKAELESKIAKLEEGTNNNVVKQPI